MDFDNGFRGLLAREEEGPDVTLDGDSLTIDCRECRFAPVPGSKECLGCMVECMCRAGGADRVVLRTGRDTEISGKAGRVLKESASLRRWSLPQDPPAGRCRGCAVSRYELLRRAWGRFPEGMTVGLASEASSNVPDREGCRECVEATVRALRQLEMGMAEIRAMMGRGPSA